MSLAAAKTETRSDADTQRVARAKRGETAAFEDLIALHAPPLHRMLTRVLGNPTDAEQVTEAAFREAWRALPGWRGDAHFSTWLYRIAMNEASRRLADDARRPTPPLNDLADGDQDPADAPPPQIEAGVPEAYLERCVAELPAAHRTAVVLRDIEGLSNEEAAHVLGITPTTFKRYLHSGRMEITRRLEKLLSTAAVSDRASG